MFIDNIEIHIKGGDGGSGCVSFRREKFVPRGGPDGGDGGDGGNIIFVTEPGEQSFVDFYYKNQYTAERGENGRGRDQHGKKGSDLKLKVPVGTIVKDPKTNKIISDLDKPEKSCVIAKGGKGGKGNRYFASSTNRVPYQYSSGTEGEERHLKLELKTIANIGLVGYPNSGKSTILNAVSAAKPKTAPYPFTTLHPVLGLVEFDDFYKMTIADIPGLIDGAHDNVGLGHNFLKHIERTEILVYILDTAAVDGRNPYEDFKALQKELEYYKKGLSLKPSVIVANKIDLEESTNNLKELNDNLYQYEIIPVSASFETNLPKLLEVLRTKLERITSQS